MNVPPAVNANGPPAVRSIGAPLVTAIDVPLVKDVDVPLVNDVERPADIVRSFAVSFTEVSGPESVIPALVTATSNLPSGLVS